MNDNEQCVRKENNTPGKILYFMCWAIVALSAVTGIRLLMVLIEGGACARRSFANGFTGGVYCVFCYEGSVAAGI